MPASRGEITQLLGQLSGGDRSALDRLVPLIYSELRALAASCFRQESAEITLQPTALVHEAYLRLLGVRFSGFDDRRQFFALAATLMRRVLYDEARKRGSAKRGGNKTVLLEGMAIAEGGSLDAFAVAEALEQLETIDPDLCRVVELRYFGGLSVEETAQALAVSTPTVKRRWGAARAWLARQLRSEPDA